MQQEKKYGKCPECGAPCEIVSKMDFDGVTPTLPYDEFHYSQHPGTAVWIKGDYDRLYDQLKTDPEKRIACYVDYDGFSRTDGGPPCRDICTIKGKRMEFTARGIGYGGAESWLDEGDKKEAFLKDCIRLNVEWMDETGQSNKDDAVAFHDWVIANEYEINNRAQMTHTTAQLYNEYKKQNNANTVG